MVTDKMVQAALCAIENKHIDARRFWTPEDRENMRAAIEAAMAIANTECRLQKLERVGLGDAAEFARNPVID